MYNREIADNIASAQRDAGWTEEQISNYAKMQESIHNEAFPTGEESLTFSQMDEIIRRNVSKWLEQSLKHQTKQRDS